MNNFMTQQTRYQINFVLCASNEPSLKFQSKCYIFGFSSSYSCLSQRMEHCHYLALYLNQIVKISAFRYFLCIFNALRQQKWFIVFQLHVKSSQICFVDVLGIKEGKENDGKKCMNIKMPNRKLFRDFLFVHYIILKCSEISPELVFLRLNGRRSPKIGKKASN